MARALAITALVLFAWAAHAQTDLDELERHEAERAQAFSDGFREIIDELNRGSFDRFVNAIDRSAMLERIFGLRLIDQKMKRDFGDQMKEQGRFAGFIASSYQEEAKDGIKAMLLLVESRGDRGRAVVRFDMPYFQANYVEYDLRLHDDNRIEIVDWTDYGWGHVFSDRMGLAMVQAQPNPNAVRKLVDFPSVQQSQVFQLTEVLKATRDRKFDRLFQIIDLLDPEMRRQRVVWKLSLDATRESRKRREQRRVLQAIDEYYASDALFALPLLDYYFPDRQYQKAYDALVRVRDKLRIDDALTNARLSAALLVMENVDEANAMADKAVAQEPGLELAWWSQFRARVAAGNYESALEPASQLATEFGHRLDEETLAKDPSMRDFARSAEYRRWRSEDAGSD